MMNSFQPENILYWIVQTLFLGIDLVKQLADQKMEKSEDDIDEFDENINQKCNRLLEISRQMKFIASKVKQASGKWEAFPKVSFWNFD